MYVQEWQVPIFWFVPSDSDIAFFPRYLPAVTPLLEICHGNTHLNVSGVGALRESGEEFDAFMRFGSDGRHRARRLWRHPFVNGLSTASKAKHRDAEKDKEGNAGNQAHRRRKDAALPEVRAVVPERMGGRARLQEMQVDCGLAQRLVPLRNTPPCGGLILVCRRMATGSGAVTPRSDAPWRGADP